MGKALKLFPYKVRDIRVSRIHLNGKETRAEYNRSYDISLLPALRMWFNNNGKAPVSDVDMWTCGLEFHFLFWSMTVFQYDYRKPVTEPWIEDNNRKYVEPFSEYMKRQKH